MQHVDDRILEALNRESWSTPDLLTIDVRGVDEGRITERCELLRSAGFVEREFSDHYQITMWGALYLDGEVSAEVRRPEPAPRPPEAVRPGWYAGFG